MRKLVFSLACSMAISAVTFAQKGNNQVGVGADVYIGLKSFGDAYKPGFGGHVKGMYGVGTAGHITLTTGYVGFKGKKTDTYDYSAQKFSVVPLLVGYRHSFSALYVEPQLGLGFSSVKVVDYKYSQTNFMYAIGGGYVFKGLDISLSFQNVGEAGEIALRAGLAYNIPL